MKTLISVRNAAGDFDAGKRSLKDRADYLRPIKYVFCNHSIPRGNLSGVCYSVYTFSFIEPFGVICVTSYTHYGLAHLYVRYTCYGNIEILGYRMHNCSFRKRMGAIVTSYTHYGFADSDLERKWLSLAYKGS